VLAQSRTAFLFGPQVASEDRAYIQAGIELAVDYLAAAGVAPVRSRLYAYPNLDGMAQALEDDLGDQIFIAMALRRLAVIPAEAHPGIILVSTGTQEWRMRSSDARIRVVAHEYFHVVQMALLGRVAERISTTRVDLERPEGPSWLFEGSADYISWKALEAANVASLDEYLASATVPKDVDIADLETYLEYYHAGEDRAVLPLLAVDRLVAGDTRRMMRFYEAIGRGLPWREAFAGAFGKRVEVFYAELRAELARR
jgi:hypothetical protein